MPRLSEAISEGDGISVLVEVADGDAARAAAAQGAEGLAVRASGGLPATVALPVLWLGEPGAGAAAGADAVVVDAPEDEPERSRSSEAGVEVVVRVHDDDQIARALDRLDPEILLLSMDAAGGDEAPLRRLLSLLQDVPAGKLAIAELAAATADDVAELERAGVDAVLVAAGDIGSLVGRAAPAV
jgi:hypothetical protein